MAFMSTLNVALKEWDLVISAMLAGRQAVLLRKGGILESDNQFELEHKQFLFYPTYVHQDPRMTKAEFRGEIRGDGGGAARWSCAVTARRRGFCVPGRKQMDELFDLHVWDSPLIDMRFNYRAEKPLYLVVVRAFVLPSPVRIANHAGVRGVQELGAAEGRGGGRRLAAGDGRGTAGGIDGTDQANVWRPINESAAGEWIAGGTSKVERDRHTYLRRRSRRPAAPRARSESEAGSGTGGAEPATVRLKIMSL